MFVYSRVSKFREDLQGMRTRFEGLKKQQAAQQLEQNRDSLLARRGGRHQTTTESSSVSVLYLLPTSKSEG